MTTITDTERRPEEEPEPEHELALADLDLQDGRASEVTGGKIEVTAGARDGGCDDWGCGMNHNEVLAVTS